MQFSVQYWLMRKKFFSSKREFALIATLGTVALVLATVILLIFRQYGIKHLIGIVGYPGLFAIIFAESGLFFGFFLPGDSLLVTAGLLATQEGFGLHILGLLPLLAFAAVLGDSVGYWSGRKFGKTIFKQEKSLLFDKKHLDKAHAFYEKHGGKTIILARFVPIIRTFAPIVAGMADMHYDTFLKYNLVGGIGWSAGMLLIGYFLGQVIPDVDHYLLPIIAIIVFISFIPPMYETYKHNKAKIFGRFMDLVAKLPFKL